MHKSLIVFALVIAFVCARSTSSAGVNLVKSFEGFRSCKYKDAVGLWTIGYGHLIKSGETFNHCLSQAQAVALLQKDLHSAESCVSSHVKTSINQHQFDALVSFTFNLGCGALSSSTLLKKVNARQFSQCCAEFRKWVHGGGKVLPGLVRRREAECKLFTH
jgi:GH24 family phage-related lysozyme (muramidase)